MDWVYIDTRQYGAFSTLMDGFFHILPEEAIQCHQLSIRCGCDPRVEWRPDAETCIVSHRLRTREPQHDR